MHQEMYFASIIFVDKKYNEGKIANSDKIYRKNDKSLAQYYHMVCLRCDKHANPTQRSFID